MASKMAQVANKFEMDSKGYCLLCLQWPQMSTRKATGEGCTRKTFSFKELIQYAQADMKTLFSNMTGCPTNLLAKVAKTDFVGSLCEECGKLLERFVKQFLELEGENRRLNLEFTLKCIIERMEKGEAKNRVEMFEREMAQDCHTLLQYQLVAKLRKEILERCSKITKQRQAQIIVKRCCEKSPAPVDDDSGLDMSREGTPSSGEPESTSSDSDPIDDDLSHETLEVIPLENLGVASEQFFIFFHLDGPEAVTCDSLRYKCGRCKKTFTSLLTAQLHRIVCKVASKSVEQI